MVTLTSALVFAVGAAATNNIWLGSSQYPQCTACLDKTFLSCPGDYHELSYAQCMCGGDGGVNLVTCVSVCDSVDQMGVGLGRQQVSAWYNYCTEFFPTQMCPAGREYMSDFIFEQNCADAGKAVVSSAVLTGEDPLTSATEGPLATTTGGETATARASVTSTGSGAATGKTSVASKTSGTSSGTGTGTATSTGAAAMGLNQLPQWGFVVGLGIQVAGLVL